MNIPSVYDSVSIMKSFLKRYDFTHCLSSRDHYIERMKKFHSLMSFPWRKDQQQIIDLCLSEQDKNIVVNGIFGAGKSTMILGTHILSILKGIYSPGDALFISFNVCIKNELTQKIRSYGIPSTKTKIRTFDSIIYEICKMYEYPYLDLPNFDGKRKFVYKICNEIKLLKTEYKPFSVSPKAIYIDECQDLEHQTLLIFETFFKDSRIIFVGDIFQSISKEPRETVLWYLLNHKLPHYICYTMSETPRVPHTILSRIKHSLIKYYPEFTTSITSWTSSSKEHKADIEWKRFYNYSGIFSEMKEFVDMYKPENCMVLLFSSAITVKGAIGDVARFRRFLQINGYNVNENYKRMDSGKLFLSTVNSSKGLERDYVFIALTFPLERAFINFSSDLVMNLINVGITRAKKKVIFYVPAYEDKFSQTLKMFETCPVPNKDQIREGKMIKDFNFSDYMNMEHCVTELIKQSIIKYDTRIILKENIKQFESKKLFEKNLRFPRIEIEEEKAFVGILIENLITSSWTMIWPYSNDLEMIRNHPLYSHCFKKIETIYKKYKSFISSTSCSDTNHFTGIYYYSQLHLAMYNKIFIDLSPGTMEYLKRYWNTLRPISYSLRPIEGKITVQNNMRMPWLTGVSDVMVEKKGERDEIEIWELKASVDMDWKDNALSQAILYCLMTGKNWTRIVLLNPFRNEICRYYFNMKKIMSLRQLVINDILVWNTNCYLSKNKSPIDRTGTMIKHSTQYQVSMITFLSPTKIDIVYNQMIKCENDSPRKTLSKIQKLALEGTEKIEIEEIDCMDSEKFEEETFIPVESLLEVLEYKKNDDVTYELDDSDSLVSCLCMASYL